MAALGWWVISGEDLMGLLRRAAAGENVEMIYVEAYVNSGHEQVDGRDDGG